jgi:phosphonate dehydrogenase
MKPYVAITRHVDTPVITLLMSICNVLPDSSLASHMRRANAVPEHSVQALLLALPEHVDNVILNHYPQLRIVSCAFNVPLRVHVEACTQRGIWVTTVMTNRRGVDAELEAARNILDVMSGDIPRGAVNVVLQPAA